MVIRPDTSSMTNGGKKREISKRAKKDTLWDKKKSEYHNPRTKPCWYAFLLSKELPAVT
jgi:hypothetical protein